MPGNKTCITKTFYFFLTFSLAALFSTSLWSAQRKSDQAAPGHVIVEIKKAEVRTAPDPAAKISEIAFKGEIFKVIKELPDWYLIELSANKEGYLSKKYARVKVLDKSKNTRLLIPKPAAKDKSGNYVLITRAGSSIRKTPKKDGPVVAQAKIDNAFKLSKEISASWYEIYLPNGKISYVPASVSKIITPAQLAKLKTQRIAAAPKPAPQPKPVPVAVDTSQTKLTIAQYAVAMKNDLILRQEPNITANIMVTAKQGDHYKILSLENDWCKVLLPDERPAAVSEATKSAKQFKLATVAVTAKSAKLYAKASETSKVIATASSGTVFKLIWVYQGWYEILASSGTAFISDKSARLINEQEPKAEPVIAPEPPALPPAKPAEKLISAQKPAVEETGADPWIKDKYVLVTTNMVNLRAAPDTKSRILSRANINSTYKLLSRQDQWYEIFLPPAQNAFISSSLAEIITEKDVLAGPKKLEQLKKARQEEELKLKQEKERKIKEEAAQREAAIKAREEEWLKDKYVLITVKKAVLQKAPNIKGNILGTVNIEDVYKLVSRRAEWYEIQVSTGAAFLNHNLGTILSESAIAEHKQKVAGEKARQLRIEAELKERQEAELKARLENERKIKEEADQRAAAAAELKVRQEIERQSKLEAERAAEEEWLKDKYIIVSKKNINLRQAPAEKAPIIKKIAIGESFKLLSREKTWYGISFSSGTAYVHSSLAEVITDKDLEAKRSLERAAAELKECQAVERKLQLEKEAAELKAKQEEKARLAKEAEELKNRQLREKAELAKRQEAERKAKLEAEQQLKLEAERIADEAWCKDKYITVRGTNANLRAEPNLSAKILANAKKTDIFKLLSKTRDWYEIFLPPDQNAFISKGLVDLLTAVEVESRVRKERELILSEQRKIEALAEAEARQESERAAKLENGRLRKAEADLRSKEEAALKARQEEELKAREIAWLQDKYILVNKQISVYPAPNKNATVNGIALPDTSFKIVTRTTEWYGIDTSSGTVFVPANQVKLLTEKELHDYRQKQEAKQQVLRQAQEAQELAKRQEAERQSKLAAEEKAKKLREKEELKKRQEAEAKARIEDQVQDKYILIQAENANLRSAPSKSSPIITRAKSGEYYKLTWIENDEDKKPWYQVNVPSGQQSIKAYVLSSLAKSITKEELDALLQARGAAAASSQAAAEAETEWLKDKYVLITINNTNLRQSARKNAAIVDQARIGTTYKLNARQKDWYEISTSSGTVFVNAGVTQVITEAEKTAMAEAERQARELQAAAELKVREEAERKSKLEKQEAEAKAKITAELQAKKQAEDDAKMKVYIVDKYALTMVDNTNIRTAPDTNAALITKAGKDEAFKIIWIKNSRLNVPWYQVSLSSGTQAKDGYIISTLAKLVTKQQLDEHRLAQKLAQQKVLQQAQEAERQSKLEAEEESRQIRDAEEKKVRELREKVLRQAQEDQELAKKESERKLKLEKQAAEEKARMEEYVKDKYILTTTKSTNCRQEPNKNSTIIAKATNDVSLKLTWITTDKQNVPWYQVAIPSGTATIPAYVMSTVTKLMTAQELNDYRLAQQKTAEEKVRLEAEAKVKEAAELKAKMEAAQKLKEEKERLARAAAELKARQEAEAKAQEDEWLKDKYLVTQYKDVNIRKTASKTAEIIQKAQLGQAFKIVSRGKEWYQIALDAGTAYIHNSVAKVFTGTELAALQQQQEVLRQAQEAERQSKLEKETQTAEQQAKTAQQNQAEQKAQAAEETEDQAEYGYVVITAPTAEIKSAPDDSAQSLLLGLKGDVFKYNGQQKDWYHILTFSGETRFVRKSLCQGSNTTPQLPASEAKRRDIYDSLIDAKDRAMTDTNTKYPSIKSQAELQEKIFYQQTVEEKFILEICHKQKIQPATYLTLLSEAISKNW